MKKYFIYKSLIELRKIWAIVKKDRYDRIANELLDVLMRSWDENTRLVINEVIRQIKGEQFFSRTELDMIIEALKIRLGEALANEVAQPLYETHLSTYIEGVKDVLQVTPTLQQIDHKAIAALQNHNIYWVHSFFDRQLADRVTRIGQTIIAEGLSRSQAGKLFESALSNELQQFSWRYWEGFANHVVTRSRELGHVDGYIQAGVEYYQVKAVLDHRTTEICRQMHGRVFHVSQAVELKNKLLNAQNPEEVKQIAPWMRPDQVEGKPTSKLPNGLALPPYHFNCRTRTVKAKIPPKISEIDLTVAGAGKLLKDSLTYIINNQEQLSVKELKKLVTRVQGAGWDNMQAHFNKHKDEEFTQWKSIEEMNAQLMDLIRRGGRDIYLQLYLSKEPRVIFTDDTLFLSIDPVRNKIKTFFGINRTTEKTLKSKKSKYILMKKGRTINKRKKIKDKRQKKKEKK